MHTPEDIGAWCCEGCIRGNRASSVCAWQLVQVKRLEEAAEEQQKSQSAGSQYDQANAW
jgi:hypothetical protein